MLQLLLSNSCMHHREASKRSSAYASIALKGLLAIRGIPLTSSYLEPHGIRHATLSLNLHSRLSTGP